jgi:hypothetical protein
MKKFMFIGLMVLLLATAAFAQVKTDVDANTVLLPGNNILIRDDFEVLDYPSSWETRKLDDEGMDKLWKVSTEADFDTTAVSTNKVLGPNATSTTGFGRRFVLQGNYNWDNYLVSVNARVPDCCWGNGFVIPLRIQPGAPDSVTEEIPFNGYVLKVKAGANKFKMTILKIIDGVIDATIFPVNLWTLAFTKAPIENWHYFAVSVQETVEGATFTLYVDNNQCGDPATDTNPDHFRSGKPGLGTFGTTVLFDEFLVVSLNGALTTVPAYRAVALGQYNEPFPGSSMTEWIEADPLLVLGNGDSTNPHNALVVFKNGDVEINGNVEINGDLNLEDNTLTIKDLVATNSVNSPMIDTDSLKVDGNTATGSLTVTGDAGVGGNLTAAGEVYANSAHITEEITGGSADISGGASVGGDLKVTGEVYANSAHITEEITGGSVNISGNADIGTATIGDTTIDGNLKVTGTSTLDGLAALNSGGVVSDGGLTIQGGDPLTLETTEGLTGTDITLSYSPTNFETNTDSLAINGTEVIDKNGKWVGPTNPSSVSIVQSASLNGTLPPGKRSTTLLLPSGIDHSKIVSVNAFVDIKAGTLIFRRILPFDPEFGDRQSYKLYLDGDSNIVLSSIGEDLQGMNYTVTILYEKVIEIPGF